MAIEIDKPDICEPRKTTIKGAQSIMRVSNYLHARYRKYVKCIKTIKIYCKEKFVREH